MSKGDKTRLVSDGVNNLKLKIAGIGSIISTVSGARHSLQVGQFPPKDLLLNRPTHLAAVLKRSRRKEEVPQNPTFNRIWRLKSRTKINGERFYFEAVIGRNATTGKKDLHQVYLYKKKRK